MATCCGNFNTVYLPFYIYIFFFATCLSWLTKCLVVRTLFSARAFTNTSETVLHNALVITCLLLFVSGASSLHFAPVVETVTLMHLLKFLPVFPLPVRYKMNYEIQCTFLFKAYYDSKSHIMLTEIRCICLISMFCCEGIFRSF